MPGNFKKELIMYLHENAMDEIMCLDSDDDEIDEIMDDFLDNIEIVSSFRYGTQQSVPKSEFWFTDTLSKYDDNRMMIKGLLRVSRHQFNLILDLIKDNPVFHGKCSALQHTVFFQLAVVLYRLGASGEGTSSSRISALFGIGDGEKIGRITKRVFAAILDLKQVFLTWPNCEQRNCIVSEHMDELPHCVGYLDGCEIPLDEAPTLDPTSYFSRKKHYSLKLQGICDPNLKFTHIFVGYPGSVHDSRIFSNSSVGLNSSAYLSNDQWLAADSAYKLTRFIITPYRKQANSYSIRKSEFNTIFSKYRVRIEHCFGFLKEKFNSLKKLRINIKNTNSHKFACEWITVCCILYNIILPHWEEDDFENFLKDHDNNVEVEENEVDTNVNQLNINNEGENKREALCSIILNED